LVALCNIKPKDNWNDSTNKSLRVTKGLMQFVKEVFRKNYAANTRETFRRQVLHFFVQAGMVIYNPDNPNLPVNSPNAHYALTDSVLSVLKSYGTSKWKRKLKQFKIENEELTKIYNKSRNNLLINVKLSNGKKIKLSPGKHNIVQAAVIKKFAPRFAHNSVVLYIGDTAKKDLYVDEKKLKSLGIPIDKHSKLPDVVIYNKSKNWLYLIEAVTSHGPVSSRRFVQLEDLLKNCKAEKIYATAFPDFMEFKKHSKNIAWETEVWIAETPEHMIHFNGDKFLGPAK